MNWRLCPEHGIHYDPTEGCPSCTEEEYDGHCRYHGEYHNDRPIGCPVCHDEWLADDAADRAIDYEREHG